MWKSDGGLTDLVEKHDGRVSTWKMDVVVGLNLGPLAVDDVSPLWCTVSTGLSVFLSVTEIVGTEDRWFVGIMYQVFLSLSLLITPLLAYYITDWRWLQAVMSVPYLLFLCCYWWGTKMTLMWKNCTVSHLSTFFFKAYPRVTKMAHFKEEFFSCIWDHKSHSKGEQRENLPDLGGKSNLQFHTRTTGVRSS